MSTSGLYCSYCGQLNDAEAEFCSRCGARQKPIGQAVSSSGIAAPSVPVTAAPIEPSASGAAYSGAAGASYGASAGGYAAGTGYAAGSTYGTAAAYTPVTAFHGYGGFWLRVVAAIIDAIVVSVVVFPIRFILMGTTMLSSGRDVGPNLPIILAGSMFTLFFQLILNWVYGAGMESSKYQATLGKMALGMKVTDLQGQRISFARATGRHFAKILSAMILMIGYIMVAFTERKQGLHDMIAGTYVLKS